MKLMVKTFLNRMLTRFGYEVVRLDRDIRHYGDEILSVYNKVSPYTMTQDSKIAELCEAVRYIAHSDIEGAIVECGVWKGGSMMAAALMLLNERKAERDLFLFDTFCGMTEPTEQDVSLSSGRKAIEKFKATARKDMGSDWCISPIDEVRSNMLSTGYPESLVHLVPGKVEDTIPQQAPKKISLLRLDTDWYESTLHELENLFDRITPGGVLIIDDYDSWQGARKATDEYLASRSRKLFLQRMGGKLGRIAVVY